MASTRLDDVEILLGERGRDVASGRMRVATGRSGVAVGFPDVPMIHVSWWAIAVAAVAVGIRRRLRRRRAS